MILSNDAIVFGTSFGARGQLQLDTFANRQTGYDWSLGGGGAFGISVEACDGRPWAAQDMRLIEVAGDSRGLVTNFTHPSGLEAVQTVECFDGLSTLRFQCSVTCREGGSASCVTDLGPLRFRVRKAVGLRVHTIRRDQYRLDTTVLGTEPFVIHGGRWNRPEHAGWLVLEDVQARECLLIGIEWERDWELALTPVDNGLELTFRLLGYRRDIEAGEALKSPRLFVSLSTGDLDDAANRSRQFLSAHVFPKKLMDFPWVSYDIWSTDHERVEESLIREMDFAADLGVDVFYVDASWWVGSSVLGTGAWGLGLGSYEEDRRKFPAGLRSLSDRAHRLGLRFGLWVDPMIIDVGHVDRGLVPLYWLVQENGIDSELRIGQEDWPPVKQLCTGSLEVQDYLIHKLSSLVNRFALDWLKWDDSALALPCCTRTDHGHGALDGNFEALKGKYRICAALLESFPELVIEQCGYPARLDYGLASYVRSNWLSDASKPSVHVRNNMEIASYIYPASYNAAWILRDDETIQENDQTTVDAIVRSRMLGLFGLGTLTGQLSERISLLPQSILDGIKRNVLLYKSFRHLLSQNTWHLSPYVREPDDWQAMEFSAWDGGQAVALLFRGASGANSYLLRLRGLDPEATFSVESFDAMLVRTESGRTLMEDGFLVTLEAKEATEIILITKNASARVGKKS